jgi:hypothetical protein
MRSNIPVAVRASIEVDEPLRAGEPCAVAVVVETTSARATRGVSVLLRGFSNLTTNATQKVPGETFASIALVLAEGERLAPGVRRYEGKLSVPEDAPPTGEGTMDIRYQLDARVKLEFPWVFDARASRKVEVARAARAERPEAQPVTMSSAGRGDGSLFVELSLDDTAFAPGEVITGAFSLGNIAGRRVDAATVSLVPRRPGVLGGGEVSVFKSLVGLREGSAVRFSLPLSPAAALSFPSRVYFVEQEVALRIDGSPVTVRIPIVIDTFAPRGGAPAPAPPLVGGARWRFTWRDEGAKAGLALEGRELELTGTLANAVEARVWPHGNGVRARLEWEALGIGISVEPRKVLSGGMSFDAIDPHFARRFSVHGREREQVEAALGEDLRRALSAFEEAELDDTGARVHGAGSARDPAALRLFLALVSTLAEAVVAAEQRLPTPSWVDAPTAAAWRAFAGATAGRFHAGSMAVTGALVDGDRIDLTTHPDAHGLPESTRLTLTIDPPAERASLLAEGAEADLVRSVVDLDVAPQVEIRPDAVVLELAGRVADPAALAAPMAEMARLARRMRGEASRGPYR